MFDAGTALISFVEPDARAPERERRSRLTLAQPARVEAGTGRLRFPSGRRVDGARKFEQVDIPLRPTSRTITARWSYRRPVGPGDGIVSVFHSRNPGHSRTSDEVGAGMAWRLVW